MQTGTCSNLEEWGVATPRSALDLTEIPGIGAKTVGTFYRDYGIDSLEALTKAIENGTISGIKGIGEKVIGNMGAPFRRS